MEKGKIVFSDKFLKIKIQGHFEDYVCGYLTATRNTLSKYRKAYTMGKQEISIIMFDEKEDYEGYKGDFKRVLKKEENDAKR